MADPAGPADLRAVEAAFRQQAEACADQGPSPLYALLMERAADDVAAGGPVARLLGDWRGHPVLDALSMRLLGAVHAEVLAGRAPELARHYRAAGEGGGVDAAVWPAFRGLVEERADVLRPRLDRQVQTNEVRRSAALLGGFLEVARSTGLPLRVLEIGSSAGLNLVWDRYAYRLGPHRWGDPSSGVRIESDWEGPPAAFDAPLEVASREGCDLSPIDLEDAEARLRLESFIWPDHPERLALMRAAIAEVRREPPTIRRARARDWLAEALAEPAPGRATVLFQSVMWWYLPESERSAVSGIVEAAGARASAAAPLAWLRKEGTRVESTDVELRRWPGGENRKLAESHWHGRWVRWLGDGRIAGMGSRPATWPRGPLA